MPIHMCVCLRGSQPWAAYEATKSPDSLHKTSDSRAVPANDIPIN